jgi:hypothetical protein
MVCGHRGVLSTSDEWSGRLLPDIDPAVIKMVLGRRAYSEEEEAEAEMMASLVSTVAATQSGHVPLAQQPFEGQRGADLDALTSALEGRGRDQ